MLDKDSSSSHQMLAQFAHILDAMLINLFLGLYLAYAVANAILRIKLNSTLAGAKLHSQINVHRFEQQSS